MRIIVKKSNWERVPLQPDGHARLDVEPEDSGGGEDGVVGAVPLNPSIMVKIWAGAEIVLVVVDGRTGVPVDRPGAIVVILTLDAVLFVRACDCH